jgi:hypothetical protein
MKLVVLSLLALAAVACSNSSEVCPSGWDESSDSPGDCAPSATYLSQTTSSLGSGVYGFMRTNTHGSGDQLVVGALVFALPASAGSTCDAASVNAVAQATTDDEGVYTMQLAPGDYNITSGEVPVCTAVHVDANAISDVALTSD